MPLRRSALVVLAALLFSASGPQFLGGPQLGWCDIPAPEPKKPDVKKPFTSTNGTVIAGTLLSLGLVSAVWLLKRRTARTASTISQPSLLN